MHARSPLPIPRKLFPIFDFNNGGGIYPLHPLWIPHGMLQLALGLLGDLERGCNKKKKA
jgi:hypothetical protein